MHAIIDTRPADRPLEENPVLGMYVLQKGRLAHVDLRMADILGYVDPFALIGRSLWTLVHPQDRGRVRICSGRRTSCRSHATQDFRVFRKDGSTIRVCLKGDNTLFQGRPANVGCLIDMTTMASIKEALERYQAILTQIDDAVAEMDLNGNILFSNTSACRKWGAPGDKTRMLNFRTYVDEDYVEHFVREYRKVCETGQPGKQIVYRVKLADGQRLTVEDSVSLMRDDDGGVKGFRILSRNISARVAAEQQMARQRAKLEAIFRSVNDAILTVDPDLKVVEANLAVRKMCRLERDEIVGRPLADCLQTCGRSCLKALGETMRRKEAVTDLQVACMPNRPQQQRVSVSSSPLLGPDGTFIGAVMVIRDTTRLNTMEEKLHQRHLYKNIVGKSRKMVDIFHMVERLADLDTTVLITGESGTGKELVAKALHYSGKRAFNPFVSVNCTALSESLLESELFGHVKGAFTGAVSDKQGRFEVAQGGTILFDEIGDVSLLIQLKLLRAVQEKSFERVGEASTRMADVRIIACTNSDLKEKINSGGFREDLYYRLKVVEISLPPLRERTEDIPLLIDYFCNHFNQKYGNNIQGVAREAMKSLVRYTWPGNVRELAHAIERTFVTCRGSEIRVEHLPMDIIQGAETVNRPADDDAANEAHSRQLIIDALNRTRWCKSKAAAILGISRQTLYRKIRKYNIPGRLL